MAAWVGNHILPHEQSVRAWLSKARVPREDIDDLIQEGYCNLVGLTSFERIDRPDAYFFSIVRNLLSRRLRRAAVVPITIIAEIDAYKDDRPSPEREVAGRRDYARVIALIRSLPEPSCRVVEMQRLGGKSQREIAAALNMSEGMVEWHLYNGIRTVLRNMRGDDACAQRSPPSRIRQGD